MWKKNIYKKKYSNTCDFVTSAIKDDSRNKYTTKYLAKYTKKYIHKKKE